MTPEDLKVGDIVSLSTETPFGNGARRQFKVILKKKSLAIKLIKKAIPNSLWNEIGDTYLIRPTWRFIKIKTYNHPVTKIFVI